MAALKLTRFGFTLHTGMVFSNPSCRVRSGQIGEKSTIGPSQASAMAERQQQHPRCHCPLFSQALMVALMLMTFGLWLASVIRILPRRFTKLGSCGDRLPDLNKSSTAAPSVSDPEGAPGTSQEEMQCSLPLTSFSCAEMTELKLMMFGSVLVSVEIFTGR